MARTTYLTSQVGLPRSLTARHKDIKQGQRHHPIRNVLQSATSVGLGGNREQTPNLQRLVKLAAVWEDGRRGA